MYVGESEMADDPFLIVVRVEKRAIPMRSVIAAVIDAMKNTGLRHTTKTKFTADMVRMHVCTHVRQEWRILYIDSLAPFSFCLSLSPGPRTTVSSVCIHTCVYTKLSIELYTLDHRLMPSHRHGHGDEYD